MKSTNVKQMKTISEVAESYLDQTEIKDNMGFEDEAFESKMKDVGFHEGQAWCSYFAELCAREALPKKDAVLSALFDASAVKTFANFKKAGFDISMVAQRDSIAIWQHYKDGVPQWQGHAAIVTAVGKDTFNTVEGNTNVEGGREGIMVAKKERPYTKAPNKKGSTLVLLGFIKVV